MREIEFKVWENTKPMRGYTSVPDFKGHMHFVKLTDDFLQFVAIHKENYEIMQYTGLLDKNNVKIFEGDILFYHSSRKSGNVVVEYVMGTFGFDCISKTQGWQLLGLYNQFCEVIGNKFENPELLGENK